MVRAGGMRCSAQRGGAGGMNHPTRGRGAPCPGGTFASSSRGLSGEGPAAAAPRGGSARVGRVAAPPGGTGPSGRPAQLPGAVSSTRLALSFLGESRSCVDVHGDTFS